MKILQLVTSRQYRGAEVFAANLSKELILLGHDILFVGLYQNDHNTLKVPGASHYDLSSKKKNFSISLVANLVKLVKNERPDIIQCNGSDTLKYMVAASIFTPPIPITYRNISIISVWLNGFAKTFVYQQMFNRVDHVTSVGSEAANDFIEALNYPKENVSIIRRGIPLKTIEPDKVAPIRDRFGIREKDKIAVHIGNFSKEKNHEFLLKVFSKIKETRTDLKLVLVGKGPLFEQIEIKIKELNLQDTVFLAGFRKDIQEILAASQCFVLSSKVEGVPGVILEAAAQKIPAIATNVGGVKEVLVNNETGFIIDNFDHVEFAERVIEVLSDKQLQLKLGVNAYNRVLDEFNPVRNAQQFEKLYLKLKKSH